VLAAWRPARAHGRASPRVRHPRLCPRLQVGWVVMTATGQRTKQSGEGLTVQLDKLTPGQYKLIISAFDAGGAASSSTNPLVVVANEAQLAAVRAGGSGSGSTLKLPASVVQRGATVSLDAARLGAPKPPGSRGPYTFKWVVKPVGEARGSPSTAYGTKFSRSFADAGMYLVTLYTTDSASQRTSSAYAVLTVGPGAPAGAALTAPPRGSSSSGCGSADASPPKVAAKKPCLVRAAGGSSKWHCFRVDALVSAVDGCRAEGNLAFRITCAKAGADCRVTQAGRACVRAASSASSVAFAVSVRDRAANTAAPVTVAVQVLGKQPSGSTCPVAELAQPA